jgi:hypothetical protein
MTGARLHHEYEPGTMRVVAGAVWRSPDALELTWQYVQSAPSFRVRNDMADLSKNRVCCGHAAGYFVGS